MKKFDELPLEMKYEILFNLPATQLSEISDKLFSDIISNYFWKLYLIRRMKDDPEKLKTFVLLVITMVIGITFIMVNKKEIIEVSGGEVDEGVSEEINLKEFVVKYFSFDD